MQALSQILGRVEVMAGALPQPALLILVQQEQQQDGFLFMGVISFNLHPRELDAILHLHVSDMEPRLREVR